MPSTYSPLLRLELIGAGEQSGLWGDTTNKNLGTLIEQAIAGVAEIPLTGGAGIYEVEALDGTQDQARCAVLKFIGFPSGPKDIEIPATEKLYVVRNDSSQNITVKTAAQISNPLLGGVLLKPSEATLVFCDGTAAVAGIETEGVGTLGVSGGGTGQDNFPTPGFIKTPGGQAGLTSAATVNLTSEVSGALPIANGGTGITSVTNGALIKVTTAGAITSLVGTSNGQLASWNGTEWVAAAPQASIPAGVITLWSGTTSNIPSGWALCNGANGTPDLRNRFIVGAGSTYAVNATGGSADAIVVSHTHTFSGSSSGNTGSALSSHSHSFSGSAATAGSHSHSINDPGHSHNYTYNYFDNVRAGSNGPSPINPAATPTTSSTTGISINSGGDHTHSVTGSIGSTDLSHTHSVNVSVSGTTGSTGSAGTNANLPPYYALAYIMKL